MNIPIVGSLINPLISGKSSSESTFNADDFFNLLIAQIQNQSPLEPMDNDQIVSQMAQMEEINQSARLNEGIEKLLFQQSFVSASNLIGKTVEIKDSSTGNTVVGVVDKIRFEQGSLYLVIGGKSYEATGALSVA